MRHIHHINAYYKPAATKVCSRCHLTYFPVFNKDINEKTRHNKSFQLISKQKLSDTSFLNNTITDNIEKKMIDLSSTSNDRINFKILPHINNNNDTIKGISKSLANGFSQPVNCVSTATCRYHCGYYVCRKHPAETK